MWLDHDTIVRLVIVFLFLGTLGFLVSYLMLIAKCRDYDDEDHYQ